MKSEKLSNYIASLQNEDNDMGTTKLEGKDKGLMDTVIRGAEKHRCPNFLPCCPSRRRDGSLVPGLRPSASISEEREAAESKARKNY